MDRARVGRVPLGLVAAREQLPPAAVPPHQPELERHAGLLRAHVRDPGATHDRAAAAPVARQPLERVTRHAEQEEVAPAEVEVLVALAAREHDRASVGREVERGDARCEEPRASPGGRVHQEEAVRLGDGESGARRRPALVAGGAAERPCPPLHEVDEEERAVALERQPAAVRREAPVVAVGGDPARVRAVRVGDPHGPVIAGETRVRERRRAARRAARSARRRRERKQRESGQAPSEG